MRAVAWVDGKKNNRWEFGLRLPQPRGDLRARLRQSTARKSSNRSWRAACASSPLPREPSPARSCPSLEPGVYKVEWKAVSARHPQGKRRFHLQGRRVELVPIRSAQLWRTWGEREQAKGRPERELTFGEFVDETGMRDEVRAQFLRIANGEIPRGLMEESKPNVTR
jgi:hypothetical protein